MNEPLLGGEVTADGNNIDEDIGGIRSEGDNSGRRRQNIERRFAQFRIVVWLLQWIWTALTFAYYGLSFGPYCSYNCENIRMAFQLVLGHGILLAIPLVWARVRLSQIGEQQQEKHGSKVKNLTKLCWMDGIATVVSVPIPIFALWTEYYQVGAFYLLTFVLALGVVVGCYRSIAAMMTTQNKQISSSFSDILSFCQSPFSRLSEMEEEYQSVLIQHEEDERIELEAQILRFEQHLSTRLQNPRLPSLRPCYCLLITFLLFALPTITNILLEFEGIRKFLSHIWTLLESEIQTSTDEITKVVTMTVQATTSDA